MRSADLLGFDTGRLPRIARTIGEPLAGPEPALRYELVAQVDDDPDDECFVARLRGLAGFDKLVFLRRCPGRRFDPPMIERLRLRGRISALGIEQLFDIGLVEERGYIVSELVPGRRLDEIEQVPWAIALALLHDAFARLAVLCDAGVIPAITSPRFRIADAGRLMFIHGVPGPDISWDRARCQTARLMLAVAATADERRLLAALLDDADSADALAIAGDALLERHGELATTLPALLADDPAARELIAACLDRRLLETFWRRVLAI